MNTKVYIVLQHEAHEIALHSLEGNDNLLDGIDYNAICFLTYTNGSGLVELLSHGIGSGNTCLISKLSTDEFCFVLTAGTQHLNDYARSVSADFIGSAGNLEPYLSEIEAPERQIGLAEMEMPY